MPPKDDPDAVMSLPEWLKLLTSRGVDMRVAMALAAKTYTSHNTRARLSDLTPQKLATLIDDKDKRKTVSNAIRGLASGQTYAKKRQRDADLLEPLQPEKQAEAPASYDFHEIFDPEQLIPLTVTVNRAPVKTAWAYVVSRRLGFEPTEALSLAHVHVHIGSLKHALQLGNILNEAETREARDELRELGESVGPASSAARAAKQGGRAWWKGKAKEEVQAVGSSQPWVQLLRTKRKPMLTARIPVIDRPDGTCRAIQQGTPVEASVAYHYITRALKDSTGAVLGAMKLVADSYDPERLNNVGSALYNEFKPDVTAWGQRGTLSVAKILDQINDTPPAQAVPGDGLDGTEIGSTGTTARAVAKAENPGLEGADEALPPTKRVKQMTVDEYEALLDAEGEGGLLAGIKTEAA